MIFSSISLLLCIRLISLSILKKDPAGFPNSFFPSNNQTQLRENQTSITNSSFLLPEDFHTLFIFTANEVSTFPGNEASFKMVSTFIQNSIPFNFNAYFTLNDFFVIQPDNFLNLTAKGQKPILTLIFEQTLPSNEKKASDSFWDTIMTDWMNLDLLNVLLHSTFCTFSSESAIQPGYCIEVTQKSVEFFQINPGELASEFLSDLSVSKALTVVNQPETFKIQLIDPKSLGSPLIRSTTRNGILLRTQLNSAVNSPTANNLKGKLEKLVVEALLNSHHTIDVKSVPIKDFGLIHNLRQAYNYSQVASTREQNKDVKINGKFIKRDELEKLLATKSLLKDEEPCSEISWHNVFHNSVFGRPRLCEPV